MRVDHVQFSDALSADIDIDVRHLHGAYWASSHLDLLRALISHDCPGKEIISLDDPRSLRIGFVCKTCLSAYVFALERFCSLPDEGPFREMFVNPEGRKSVAFMISVCRGMEEWVSLMEDLLQPIEEIDD